DRRAHRHPVHVRPQPGHGVRRARRGERRNLQSDGKVSGTTGGSRVIVFSEDGTPFTVSVRLADSASQSTGFRLGGQALAPASGNASVLSSTHWSNLVLTLPNVTMPDRIPGGATWTLTLRTQR